MAEFPLYRGQAPRMPTGRPGVRHRGFICSEDVDVPVELRSLHAARPGGSR